MKLENTPLEDHCQQEPLGDLLQAAISVTELNSQNARSVNWLARNAIRAVCKEIIRIGELTTPFEVRFAGREELMQDIFRASRN